MVGRKNAVTLLMLAGILSLLAASMGPTTGPTAASTATVSATPAQNGAPNLGISEPQWGYSKTGVSTVWDLTSSTELAGVGEEWATDVAVDASGNVYVVGYTASGDFPATSGAYSEVSAGSYDAFVAKLAPNGSVVWATYFGGQLGDYGYGIAVGNDSSVWFCGITDSDAGDDLFPVTAGAYQGTYGENLDAFVAQLAANGSTLLYCSYYGGIGADYAYDLTIDSHGVVWVVGSSTTANLAALGTPYDSTHNGGGRDVILFAMDAAGHGLYSTYIGGSGAEEARSVALVSDTSTGTVMVALAARTASTNWPVTSGAPQSHALGGAAWAITVHSTTSYAGSLNYSTYWGRDLDSSIEAGLSGEYYEFPHLAYDSSTGQVVVVGCTDSGDWSVTPGAPQPELAAGDDAYIAWFRPDSQGTVDVKAATYWGGNHDDHFLSVAIGPLGRTVAAGSTRSTDWPVRGSRSTGRAADTYRDPCWVRFSSPAGWGTDVDVSSCVERDRWGEDSAVAVDPTTGDARAAGQTSTAGAAEQDVVVSQYVLPEAPLVHREAVTSPDAVGEYLRVTVNATASCPLSGAEVDSAVLRLLYPNGTVHSRSAGVLDDTVPEVRSARVRITSPGSMNWTVTAYSVDGGATTIRGDLTIAGNLTTTGKNKTAGGQEGGGWELDIADYWWYLTIAVICIACVVSAVLMGPVQELAIIVGPCGVALPTVLVVLSGWDPLYIMLPVLVTLGWTAAAVKFGQENPKLVLCGGGTAACAALIVAAVMSGAHYAWWVLYGFVAAGLVLVAAGDKLPKGKVIWPNLGKILSAVAGIITLILAILPLIEAL